MYTTIHARLACITIQFYLHVLYMYKLTHTSTYRPT